MPTPPSTAARPDLATEEDVERLVRAFYRRAAVDDLLGPVFDAAELDWDAHIPRVTAFWSWQLLGGRRYDGRPLRSHQRVNQLVPFTERHYERWLELFTATLHEGWDGPVADLAERRAHRMARSMRRVLAGPGAPVPDGADEQRWAEPGAAGDGLDMEADADLDADAVPGVERSERGGLVMRVALGRRPVPGEERDRTG